VTISRKRICDAIDEADASFQRCWSTLAQLKEGELDATWRDQFAAFQYTLARALFRLDDLYRSVAGEERGLISRKGSLSASWFTRTMERLKTYGEALKQAMRIGKRLGDSFAWLFYQREAGMIRKHLEHPGNLHTPPGIGGRGELGFIKHVPIVDGHIVVYHGITNFLRIGDISFIDLRTLKLTAIGELKTKQEGDRYVSSIFLLGDKDLPKQFPSMRPRSRKQPRSGHKDKLPKVKSDQLERQMRKMGEVLDESLSDKRHVVREKSNLERLEELLGELRSDKLTYRRIDDGLTAFGIKQPRKTKLSSRLLPRRTANVSHLAEGVETYILELMTPDLSINSLQQITLRTGYVPGQTPLLWSPLPAALLKPLVFEEAFVSLLFNAAPLIQKLRARGYEVELDAKRKPERIIRRRGERALGFEGMWYLLDLIRYQCFSEDAVIHMIDQVFELMDQELDRDGASAHRRIEIDFQQFFDEAPPL
jgi:hypothetical protein